MRRILPLVVLVALLPACQMLSPKSSGPRASTSASAAVDGPAGALQGEFDNHEQAASARADAAAVLHVNVMMEPTSQDGWILLRIRLDAATPLDATWAMQRIAPTRGTAASWIPHRPLVAAPASGKAFDAKQWAALDACALRADNAAQPNRFVADPGACSTIVPGSGTLAALLPIALEMSGDMLMIRLYADQARGADAQERARRVRWFTGWAAVNGAGPQAGAENHDWHVDRALRIGSEGGRSPLRFRDGRPTGYSLGLEQMTYQNGNTPVLKLSVIDDATGRSLAYAWTNPEASRIGINLGWVQIGLDCAGAVAPAAP